jgi:hypothetical protein
VSLQGREWKPDYRGEKMKDLLTQLDQDLELEAKATPGPWVRHEENEGDTDSVIHPDIKKVGPFKSQTGCDEDDDTYTEVCRVPVEKYGYGCAWSSENNANLIVFARNTFRSRAEALKVAIKALRCENTKALCESEPKNRNCKFVYGKALCFNCIAVEKITKLLGEVKGCKRTL